jgi:3-hydroxybutyrate dehydrogenase
MLMTKPERPLSPIQRELEGETAIVTGSTSGIGLGIAQALARRGANVVLNGFGDAGEIEIVRAALAAEHEVEVAYDGADMSRPEAINRMIDAAAAHFGRINILVNNAGIQHVAPIEEFPPAKWDAILAINLSAAFHTTRAVFAGMKERGWGRIVNVASAHALVASPFKSAYVAAKHGLFGLTKTVALEGAQFNVRCNAISPGYVLTALVESQIPDTMKARNMTREQVINDVLLAAQPTKEFVKVEEVAGLALFLTTAPADQINGAALSIDGGWIAQ